MTARAVAVQFFVLIYFQRLAIPVGPLAISVPLVATVLALLALAAARRLTFSRTRLVLFAVMAAWAALSQAVCPGRSPWRASLICWRSISSTRCGWSWLSATISPSGGAMRR